MKMRKMELLVLFLAIALTASIAQAQDITTGLMGYWPFAEGFGTETADVSGNGYKGTFLGAPEWAEGPGGFGNAIQFRASGQSDGIECGTCNPSDGTGEFTLALWAYWNGTTGIGTQHFLTKGGYREMWQMEVWENHSSDTYKDRIGMSYAPASVPFVLMPAGEWVHVAFTFDGTHLALYLDGQPDGTGPQAFAMGTNEGSTFYIGVSNVSTRSFDGRLDEVRVYNRVLSQSDIQRLMATDKAINISPASGAINVPVDTDLVWGPPPTFTPSKYDLYYKEGDPNFATGTVTVVTDIARTDPCNVHNPSEDFAYNTTYYWRVDSYAPSYPSDPCIGGVWSFTTAPAEPVITKDPVPLAVAIGGTAVFTVEHVNGETFVWKKLSDGLTVGGDSSTLTLTNVQKADEDSYYCIASNTSGSALPSAAAALWTKRLIARWEFEDDLLDAEADNWDGVYTDPNTENTPPTAVFASGLEGQALQLTEDELHVRITDSEDFFNFYPLGYTVNLWVRTELSEVWGCMASKQLRVDYPDWDGWVLNCNNEDKASTALRQVFGAASGKSIVGTSNIVDNEWHMVTGTYDAETGTGSIYVDGKLENQLVDTERKAMTNNQPVVIGAETALGEFSYEGLLDKMSIYSYGLSPLEVAVLYTDVRTDESICVQQPENDFNDDCRVDLLDFAMLSTGWLECNLVPDSLCP